MQQIALSLYVLYAKNWLIWALYTDKKYKLELNHVI